MNPLGKDGCFGACMPSNFVADWNTSSLSMQTRMEHIFSCKLWSPVL